MDSERESLKNKSTVVCVRERVCVCEREIDRERIVQDSKMAKEVTCLIYLNRYQPGRDKGLMLKAYLPMLKCTR